MTKQRKTSWESSAKWYNDIVGESGHYYHKHLIIPNLLKWLKEDIEQGMKVLDLACGQGIWSRALPEDVGYLGVEISPSLINAAKNYAKGRKFVRADLSRPQSFEEKDFTHACVILALQNIEHPEIALQTAAKHLKKGGKLFLVINHPCFRIPRQSHWEFDESKKLQYRRVDMYMTPLKIPIQTHPGKKGEASKTLSFHNPLSAITRWVKEAGFVITEIDEWISDKKSTGGKAKQENRARKEFPLFMAIQARLD